MEKYHCTCAYKRTLAERMLKIRESMHEKETGWIDLLLPNRDSADMDEYCCLLTFMFYYGYCEECSVSVTEYARDVLGPLMVHHPDGCKLMK